MRLLTWIIALGIIILGVIGLIAPYELANISGHLITPTAIYLVAVLRVAVGLVLLGVSRESRFPPVIRVLGIIVILAGLTTPIIGSARSRAVLDWWMAQGSLLMRLWMCVALAFGAFLAYAVTAPRTQGNVQ